ncbi:hypothetical protein EG240_00610 [Paenimyroides tangerinum]|uniref:Uncharacterized protein n=1 Tax=Paenimyroides tangerinum TaxID=2488728 RepID=A0A3P3WDR8_9FLAO|nr:hypothetical protein [Paenimyroides tangerinum]RRJ93301.1 hypothetical protein EG240_00610 [Paenimyroides tangerinum]
MERILVGTIFLVIGLIGIIIQRIPKFRDGPGFAAEMKFYIYFYVLAFVGIFILSMTFFEDK